MSVFDALDIACMTQALALAEANIALARPNPSVGCVIAQNGEIIAHGATQAYGDDHAEQAALKQAGERARGATLYVTLEPCAHVGASGRAQSCTQSILQAGIARVVIAAQEENPAQRGHGIAALCAEGLKVDVGCMEAEAHAHHIGFLTRMRRGTPWVRAKMAASLDGRTALASGVSQWITGEAARADGHAFRARACAVLAGSGTLKGDNPRLTVRHAAVAKQPLRVLLDHANVLTPEMNVFTEVSEAAPVLVVSAAPRPPVAPKVQTACFGDENGRIDLSATLRYLAVAHQVNELHLEAGARLTGAFLQAQLVDELLIYLAPSVIGPQGKEMFSLPQLFELPAQNVWEFFDVQMIGADLRVRLRKKVN